MQQLAMAVSQKEERLKHVPVNAAPAHNPTATVGGPPSAQVLQNALASLRRVPAEAPDVAEDVPADNFAVDANTRPSDPFARKFSTSTTRSSFEPTVYLGDMGVQRMSGMYHRESQSMRPSCAPVPELSLIHI